MCKGRRYKKHRFKQASSIAPKLSPKVNLRFLKCSKVVRKVCSGRDMTMLEEEPEIEKTERV